MLLTAAVRNTPSSALNNPLLLLSPGAQIRSLRQRDPLRHQMAKAKTDYQSNNSVLLYNTYVVLNAHSGTREVRQGRSSPDQIASWRQLAAVRQVQAIQANGTAWGCANPH
jgi:hypothetical protein